MKNIIKNKIAVVFIFILFIILNNCSKETPEQVLDILEKIRALPGVTVIEIDPYYGYPRAFQIDITQPVDHNNPYGPQFTQRMYLSHSDESLPMVFAPSGTAVTESYGQELAAILQTNCLNVTHRYFDGAKPDPLDWQYLTIRQAAADHHKIVTLFKTIYPGPWVSAGASKGGLTPLFHKRFYPDDVDAVVAYVAPFMFGIEDQRYADYLAAVGTAEERDRVHAFQRRLLENRDVLVGMFAAWFGENGCTYSGDPEFGFEDEVISYGWTYWQYGSIITSEIPGPDAAPETLLAYLNEATFLSRSSDEYVAGIMPWIYQASTEMGHPALPFGHLEDLLLFEPENIREYFLRVYGFPVPAAYDPGPLLDIYRWIREEGDNLIFIYGSDDPWSGGAVELTGQTNALYFMHEGGDHKVKIEHLDQDQQDLILGTLEQWLGITIDTGQSQGIMVEIQPRKENLFIK
ncbi:MAG: hypothetical protein GY950_29815 [bacterium]|nr:hypothetical protein [bacterium]